MNTEKTKKYKVKPTLRQKRAFQKMVENGGNLRQALECAGYSKAIANNPHRVVGTEGWKQLQASIFSNDKTFLANVAIHHAQLLEAKKKDCMIFPSDMENEEIIESITAVGIEIIHIQESKKYKVAFYQSTDIEAVFHALDMAYKIKGLYKC